MSLSTARSHARCRGRDFVRLAAKLGYGGVDVNLNAAKTDGVEATRALFKELNVKPAVANLPAAVHDA